MMAKQGLVQIPEALSEGYSEKVVGWAVVWHGSVVSLPREW